VAAGVDVDPHCKYPYEHNNHATFIERDVAKLHPSEVASHFLGAPLTLLAGCAPCQPFSKYSRTGRGRTKDGEWALVESFGRLVRQVRPHFVTMENVPQLLDHRVFEQFLKALNGYATWFDVIDCSLVGVPQTRRRLVLIASRLSDEAPKLTARPSGGRRVATVRKAIGRLPPLQPGESSARDPLHVVPSLSPLNLRRIRASVPGGSWRDWPPALQAACHRKASGTTYPSVYGRMEWDQPSPTITTQCFGYGNGRFGHPSQDRAISLREAALLQTFPRTYEFAPKGAPIRFNQMGRLIGNAVPVKLGEAIAKAIRGQAEEYRTHAVE